MIWPIYKTIEDNSGTLPQDIRTVIIGDLHYQSERNLIELNLISTYLKNLNKEGKIDYIFINGDLINQGVVNDYNPLLEWIEKLSTFVQRAVIIVDGNHDRTKRGVGIWEPADNLQILEDLKSLKKKTNYLSNNIYEDELIKIWGLSLPFEYFHEEGKALVFYDPSFYEQLLKQLKKEENTKLGFFQAHEILTLYKYYQRFENIYPINNSHIIMGGHYHDGGIPTPISFIFGGNFGIIGTKPNLEIHPFKRGIMFQDGKYYVMSPAVATTNRYPLKSIFPPGIMILDIKREKRKILALT